ncbi:hypothetical protein P152DRAFT_390910 [Eremomyces bilateralis CBS 781.70]|uniref:Uncharacterized protein n=1 Tax=Eremomyces bilateralis CBS 781.70 TaxID=1392243 RepID=A0A6G1GCM7_9PEZI|nr:uncharacterized protein P152DRAFT_390910 [Eremomyces bilateralis CBS 781.70]KAF1815837.1 hypothetical protein P152DRAFT_390910 [Eremomyces bilateralis CBS 781.70]
MSESSGSPLPTEKEEPASPHSSSSEFKTSTVFVNQFQTEAIPAVKQEATPKGPARRTSKRPGGRARGTHLTQDKAEKVKELRDIGSCWLCAIQRDECTPGSPCDRCYKRALRPQADLILGCDRTKLPDLKDYFIPDVITSMHDTNTLKNFVNRHIRRFTGNTIRIKFTFIYGLPGLDHDVVEFEPKTNELLRQFQYIIDPATGRQDRVEKASPPLGITKFDNEDTKIWEKYLNDLVEHHLDGFAEICFEDEPNDFQFRLLKLMCNLKPEDKNEKLLLREMFRLLMVTYIMGHTVTIPDASREQYLSKLKNFRSAPYGRDCSPRMANRQFKYFFLTLHKEIMNSVLRKLQFLIRSSKGCTKWTSAFCTILGLAMVLEDQQRTIHLVTDTDFAQGKITAERAARQAEDTCRVIDDQFLFLASLFRWKYNRQFNPLRDGVDKKNEKIFGPRAMLFINEVDNLVREKCECLPCVIRLPWNVY